MNRNQQFVMLPADEFEEILKMTKEIHQQLCEKKSSPKLLNEFISEVDAKKEFGRQTTWFWSQRKNGRLPYKRLGTKVYYQKEDLLKLFEQE
jgi:hypothetical protein